MKLSYFSAVNIDVKRPLKSFRGNGGGLHNDLTCLVVKKETGYIAHPPLSNHFQWYYSIMWISSSSSLFLKNSIKTECYIFGDSS